MEHKEHKRSLIGEMKSWADLLCLAGRLEQSQKTENVKPEGVIEKQYIQFYLQSNPRSC